MARGAAGVATRAGLRDLSSPFDQVSLTEVWKEANGHLQLHDAPGKRPSKTTRFARGLAADQVLIKELWRQVDWLKGRVDELSRHLAQVALQATGRELHLKPEEPPGGHD